MSDNPKPQLYPVWLTENDAKRILTLNAEQGILVRVADKIRASGRAKGPNDPVYKFARGEE